MIIKAQYTTSKNNTVMLEYDNGHTVFMPVPGNSKHQQDLDVYLASGGTIGDPEDMSSYPGPAVHDENPRPTY